MYMITCDGLAKIKADLSKYAPSVQIHFENLAAWMLDLESRFNAGLSPVAEIPAFLTASGRVEYVRLDASQFEEIENVTL
jgi:hypothetical protein